MERSSIRSSLANRPSLRYFHRATKCVVDDVLPNSSTVTTTCFGAPPILSENSLTPFWIARAEVIDTSKLGGDKVVFGATVDLVDQETEKTVSYRLVGELEADLKKRWLAVTSPVARALIGKKVGDIATVQSPGGVREYEITEVRFEDPEE